MSRRIDVELTSQRPDGSWTWRAAKAKQPKGDVSAALVPGGAKVGDLLRVEAEFAVDGIEVVSASFPKADGRAEPERIVVTGTRRRDDQLVTTTYAERPKGRGGRRHEGDDRGPRGRDGRDGRDGRGRDGDRGRDGGPGGRRGPGAPGGPGGPGGSGGPGRSDRGPRTDGRPDGRTDRRPDARRGAGSGGGRDGGRDNRDGGRDRGPRDDRRNRRTEHEPPRLKRLKAGRKHRNAVVRALPDIQRPLAQILLRGGIAEVRQAIEKQNALAKADGLPLVSAKIIESVADKLLPLLRSAEWYDRADAALAQIDQLDLRDLRSVVVAADSAARDDAARALAGELRTALGRRVDEEHNAWLAELAELLGDSRVVRALRLSSRPPKAGAPLPPDVAQALTAAANESLTADTFPDRYAMVVEAVAYSPVRLHVVPAALPTKSSDELTRMVTKVAGRVPRIAQAFGIEPTAPAPRGGRPATAPVPPPPT